MWITKIIISMLLFANTFAEDTFKFVLKNGRTVSNPVNILTNEAFNIQYITTNSRQPYTFLLTDSNGKTIINQIEKHQPYFLYGDSSGQPNFKTITNVDTYTLTISPTKSQTSFNIVSSLSPTTTTSTTSSETTSSTISSETTTSTTTSGGPIDISYCSKGFPVSFNKDKDHISLHYDMSYDPDDYLSAVADRASIDVEITKPNFLRDQTSRVIGTCGGSCSGYNKPANLLMQYTYGDVGGYAVTIGANDPSKYKAALNYELPFYKDTISRGGRVFVKEGGESDFTKRIIEQLEDWLKGSGKCVYIVQHSATNEKNNGSGVLSYVKSKANYIKISDGNPPYQKKNYVLAGKSFDYYALQSYLQCAWQLAFNDFKLLKSYCTGKPEPVQKCVDFSDTHELLYILGIDSSGSASLGMDGFVQKYLKSTSERLICKPSLRYFVTNINE